MRLKYITGGSLLSSLSLLYPSYAYNIENQAAPYKNIPTFDSFHNFYKLAMIGLIEEPRMDRIARFAKLIFEISQVLQLENYSAAFITFWTRMMYKIYTIWFNSKLFFILNFFFKIFKFFTLLLPKKRFSASFSLSVLGKRDPLWKYHWDNDKMVRRYKCLVFFVEKAFEGPLIYSEMEEFNFWESERGEEEAF